MAVGAAQRVSLGAPRAAKAARGVGSAPPVVCVAEVLARAPLSRSSQARGQTVLRLPPCGASHGSSVNCAARPPAPFERAAAAVPCSLRAARRNLPPRAAAADDTDLSAHTISVRVRLSGAAGPAGDLVLSGVAPGSTTVRALVARWAAELGVSAAPCTAVARADGAGADEVPLGDPDATLSAAGVGEGGVVLVELAPGFKLITLRLSADKECLVRLHGALGMANVLRRYNAAALRKVMDASRPQQDIEVSEFEWLESGATYAPVPRESLPAVLNVTLLRELLPRRADSSTLPPLVYRHLTSGAFDRVLHDAGALGVSATRDLRELLYNVADLEDGATYYLAPREVAADEVLKQQVSNLIGHNTNLTTGLEHEAGECVCRIVRALHPDGDVVRLREKLYVPWVDDKRLEIDEVVLLSDGPCAYIVEAENVLSESSGDELQKRLDVIRDMKDKLWCPSELRRFAGKHVYGVLCGRSVQLKQSSSRFASPDALVADWKARGYKLLLPSGAALASGDSLFSANEFSC